METLTETSERSAIFLRLFKIKTRVNFKERRGTEVRLTNWIRKDWQARVIKGVEAVFSTNPICRHYKYIRWWWETGLGRWTDS